MTWRSVSSVHHRQGSAPISCRSNLRRKLRRIHVDKLHSSVTISEVEEENYATSLDEGEVSFQLKTSVNYVLAIILFYLSFYILLVRWKFDIERIQMMGEGVYW